MPVAFPVSAQLELRALDAEAREGVAKKNLAASEEAQAALQKKAGETQTRRSAVRIVACRCVCVLVLHDERARARPPRFQLKLDCRWSFLPFLCACVC